MIGKALWRGRRGGSRMREAEVADTMCMAIDIILCKTIGLRMTFRGNANSVDINLLKNNEV